jgi:SAGA-associated factor 29
MSARSDSIDSELEKNLRENIRLGEKIQEDGTSLDDKFQILAALRNSHESEAVSASRSASVGKVQRDRQTKRKLTDTIDDRDSIAADSPGGHSSPKVMVSNKDRLKAMSAGSRAGSVPAVRESSVKTEDAPEGQDQLKGKTRRSSKASTSSRRGTLR